MRRFMLCLILMYIFTYTAYAEFDFTISNVFINDTLNLNSQSLLVEGAGVDVVNGFGSSYIEVQDTSIYQAGSGGISRIYAYNSTSINILGGEIDGVQTGTSGFNMEGGSILSWMNTSSGIGTISGGYIEHVIPSGDSVTTITGGTINSIQSGLNIDSGTRMFFVCDLESLTYTYNGGLVVGIAGDWLNGSSFDIEIINNGNGYSPTIEYLSFIPEPTTLVLLGLGGLLIRKRKY